MSLSEEFKEAINSGNLKQAFLIAFSKNLEFRIVTSIVSPTNDSSYSWQSNLSLIKGVETRIDGEFLAQSPQNLKQFHQQQLKQANQNWQQNRKTIIKIFHLLAKLAPEVSHNLPQRQENLDLTELLTEQSQRETREPMQLEVDENEGEGNWVEGNSQAAIPADFLTTVSEQEPALPTGSEYQQENPEQPLEAEEWDNLLDEMETGVTSGESSPLPELSFSRETEETDETEEEMGAIDDDDWEEWLDEGNTAAPDSAENFNDHDWEGEQNWLQSASSN